MGHSSSLSAERDATTSHIEPARDMQSQRGSRNEMNPGNEPTPLQKLAVIPFHSQSDCLWSGTLTPRPTQKRLYKRPDLPQRWRRRLVHSEAGRAGQSPLSAGQITGPRLSSSSSSSSSGGGGGGCGRRAFVCGPAARPHGFQSISVG